MSGEIYPASHFHHASSMPGLKHLVKPEDAFVEPVFGLSQVLYLGIRLGLAYPLPHLPLRGKGGVLLGKERNNTRDI